MVTLRKSFLRGKCNFNDISAQIHKIMCSGLMQKRKKIKNSGIFLMYNNEPNKLYTLKRKEKKTNKQNNQKEDRD